MTTLTALLLSNRIFGGSLAGEADNRKLGLHFDDGAVAGALLVGAQLRAARRIDERFPDIEHREFVANLDAALGAEVDPRAVRFDLDDQSLELASRIVGRAETREVVARGDLLDHRLGRLLNRFARDTPL